MKKPRVETSQSTFDELCIEFHRDATPGEGLPTAFTSTWGALPVFIESSIPAGEIHMIDLEGEAGVKVIKAPDRKVSTLKTDFR